MKIYSVQYLRGVAAVLVLIAHSIMHPANTVDSTMVRLGTLGVALFFVISGFIMVLICGDGPFDRFAFYRKRIARVVPLYWLATFAVAFIAIVAPTVFKNTEFSVGQLVMSLLFIPHHRPGGEVVPLLKLGWTLNLEMFFYLCFGLLSSLRATTRVVVLSVAFVGAAIVGILFSPENAIVGTYTMFDLVSFAIGMWVGLATLKGAALTDRFALQPVIFGVSTGLIASAIFLVPSTRLISPLVIGLQALGSAGLLLVGLGIESRLPRLSFAALLGDASYSIYLVHMYFVGATVLMVRHLAPAAPIGVIVLLAIAGGCLAGIAVHLLVERPIMELTRRRRAPQSKAANSMISIPRDGLSPALMRDEASAVFKN